MEPVNDWVMPPVIEAVAPSNRELIISGRASPLGRVAISGSGGLAYAAGADEAGRFELRVPRPAQDTLFVVEARVGQRSYPAPYRLLIGADPSSPMGLLAVGTPTQRLDPGPSLDAVDSDRRAVSLTGRATPEAAITIDGTLRGSPVAGPDGRWRLVGAVDGPMTLSVNDTVYRPVLSAGGVAGSLERAGDGWRITWSGSGGGIQTTWFPDRSLIPR